MYIYLETATNSDDSHLEELVKLGRAYQAELESVIAALQFLSSERGKSFDGGKWRRLLCEGRK